MLPARSLSDTPRLTLDLGRLSSRKERRKSDAMPSEMSWSSSRACLPFLRGLVTDAAETGTVVALEWQETDELHHLAKFSKILSTVLHLLQSVADCVHLMYDLEEGVAHWAFVE
jgi:hypothetical protein